MQSLLPGNLRLGQLHYVLDTLSQINETNRIVLQAQSGKCRKLLMSRLLIRCFIRKTGEYHTGIRHNKSP